MSDYSNTHKEFKNTEKTIEEHHENDDFQKHEENEGFIKNNLSIEILNKDEYNLTESFFEIFSISLPTMIFYICLFGFISINLAIAGHNFSKEAIDGVGVCNLYVACLLLSWTIGLFSGFETLAPNAYATKNYHLFGLYFQRAQLIGNFFMLFLIIIHLIFSKMIISTIVKNEAILDIVGKFIYPLIIATFFDAQFSLNFKYLNIIGKSYIGSIIIFISLLLHLLFSYIFVYLLGYGVQGLGYSLIISHSINAILGSLYIFVYQPLPESIFWYYSETFNNWGEYLRITIPGTILICAQWTAFEALSFIAFWIGELDYTVHLIIYNLWMISTVNTNGMCIAAVIIIAKEIALGNYNRLKKNVLTIFAIGISIMFALALCYIILRIPILHIYTDDQTVVEKGKNVMIILGFVILSDFCQSLANASCRGLNRYNVSLIISFSNFYVVQLILSIVLGKYTSLGVFGIWCAVLIGCVIALSAFLLYIRTFDLNGIHQETVERINRYSDHKKLTEKKEGQITELSVKVE